jgi:hypothetical protein
VSTYARQLFCPVWLGRQSGLKIKTVFFKFWIKNAGGVSVNQFLMDIILVYLSVQLNQIILTTKKVLVAVQCDCGYLSLIALLPLLSMDVFWTSTLWKYKHSMKDWLVIRKCLQSFSSGRSIFVWQFQLKHFRFLSFMPALGVLVSSIGNSFVIHIQAQLFHR